MKPDQSSASQTSINRRSFLKSSAVVAGTAVLGTLELSRSVHAAESNIIKLGLVGCGGRGSGAASDALSASSHAYPVPVLRCHRVAQNPPASVATRPVAASEALKKNPARSSAM